MKRSVYHGLGFAALLLCIATFCHNSRAERVGNFEITAQPVSKEVSQVTGQGATWTDKRKSQTMVYKVRIDYKSIDPLDDVTVYYMTSSVGASKNTSEGSEHFDKLAPQQKIEFETKGIENSYMQYTWDGGNSRYGKAQLKGIAIRIMKGTNLLAEWAQPSDMKSLWKK